LINRKSREKVCVLPICAVQKQFIDELKRVLSQHHGHSRALTEGAAVTCVKLCKSSTYVNITDRANVLFVLVHTVNQDLKVSLVHGWSVCWVSWSTVFALIIRPL